MTDREHRAILVAEHIIETKDTIRKTAKIFKVSKSTIHRDLSKVLPKLNPDLHNEVQKILNDHIDARGMNGGLAYARQVLGYEKYNKRHVLHKDEKYNHPKFKEETIMRLYIMVNYIINKQQTTVKEIAKEFGISTNNVYEYMRRLKTIDKSLYDIIKPKIKAKLH